jgi:hypothetical protein
MVMVRAAPSAGATDVTRCVTGRAPGRSTVTTSPTAISAAGISRTTASEPAGMVGLIDPVLNMMSVMLKNAASSTRTMQTTPPMAARVSSASPSFEAKRGFSASACCMEV